MPEFLRDVVIPCRDVTLRIHAIEQFRFAGIAFDFFGRQVGRAHAVGIELREAVHGFACIDYPLSEIWSKGTFWMEP